MQKNILSIVALCVIWLTFFAPSVASLAQAQSASSPVSVNIPGTHQNELGCPGEWQPDCQNTMLIYDEKDDVWQGTFEIQPGIDDDKRGPRYKAALLKDAQNIDPDYRELVLLFNARPDSAKFADPAFVGKDFTVHPVQQNSADTLVRASKHNSVSGAFSIAGPTTAVFTLFDVTPVLPTPTATQVTPAIADPNVILTLAGVIGSFVAVVVMLFALRQKGNK